jgi:hypothetical protein
VAKLRREPDLERLRATNPAIVTFCPGQSVHRIYKRSGAYPTLWNMFRHYGPLSRFDHHIRDEHGAPWSQDRGVLYVATDVLTAVAEYFQRNRRRVNRSRHQPWLVSFHFKDEIRLLDLTDTFCVRVGGSMKLVSGPFSYSQTWSRGFYEAYPEIDGLYYLSSLTNRPTIALYERANRATVFPQHTRMHRALTDPLLHKALTLIVDEIGYRLQ